MGKIDLEQQQQGAEAAAAAAAVGVSRIFFSQRCTVEISRIFRRFNFKCVVVLLLCFAVFISSVYWLFPLHSKQAGFDAKQSIKQSASVQAYFKLQKPVSELIPYVARLEYDIYEEIGVPYTKVAVLSMHQSGVSNWTNVVFGFLSDPMIASIDPVSFSVLKSSLIDLFLQQSNLTLTNSLFGQPSSFDILKFPSGITLIPKQSASFLGIPQILFNFTLHNSISEINENYIELIEQLKIGLQLRPHENVFVQVAHKNGSTRDPPVIVKASVTSDNGNLSPQRLKQLAQIISRSPGKNLGLDNSVFGNVKEVSLSSYLNHSIHASPPSISPPPSPMQNDYPGPSISPYPAIAARSGGRLLPSPGSEPPQSLPPTLNSPPPTTAHCGTQLPPSPSPSRHSLELPPQASTGPPSSGPKSRRSSGPSPLPIVSYSSSKGPDKGNGAPPPHSTSISSSKSSFAVGSSHKKIWWFCLCGFLTLHLLCWTL